MLYSVEMTFAQPWNILKYVKYNMDEVFLFILILEIHLQQSLFCVGKSDSSDSQSNGVAGSINSAGADSDKEVIIGSTRLVSTSVFTQTTWEQHKILVISII